MKVRRLIRFVLSLAVLALTSSAARADDVTGVPATFGVAGRQAVLTLHGVGAQIYQCQSKPDGSRAWAFREPIASLMRDDVTVGRHYAGPTWDMAEGGVTGKAVASVPGATPGDIPQLELQVAARHGGGPLVEAQLVLRLHTVGGTLSGSCERDGDLRSVPYQADYVFLK